jgi:prefoldin subunit 5
MPSALDDAASLLRSRIRELDDERKKLERALANLTGDASAVGAPAAHPDRGPAARPSPDRADAAPAPTRRSG